MADSKLRVWSFDTQDFLEGKVKSTEISSIQNARGYITMADALSDYSSKLDDSSSKESKNNVKKTTGLKRDFTAHIDRLPVFIL